MSWLLSGRDNVADNVDNVADNLQIDKIKPAVGNTWGSAKLSWLKDSSSAEQDLLTVVLLVAAQ